MAKTILPNSGGHTLHLSSEELKDHRQLLLLGSILSQLFHETETFWDGIMIPQMQGEGAFSYVDGLERIIQFIQSGRDYAQRWDHLAARMQTVYEKQTK